MNHYFKLFLPLIVGLCVSASVSSQITFDKGYFIDHLGDTTKCLIRNADWKNNPLSFTYKLSEMSEANEQTVNGVKEFGISDNVKYKAAQVDIDRSGTQNNELSRQRKPEFSNERVFLKAMVEGEANLYVYTDGSLKRYFFSVKGSEVKQLIYKQYVLAEARIVANNYFKQQLVTSMKCPEITATDFKTLSCTKSALLRLFEKYNRCVQSPFKVYKRKKSEKALFSLSAQVGVGFNALKISNGYYNQWNTNFEQKSGIACGVEAEVIMPFNRNKWGLVFAPSYQSYSTSKVNNGNNIEVDYTSLELPVGIRHYFF